MGLFTKERTIQSNHRAAFKRKLKRVPQRDLEDMLEGHVGQLSIAILAMRQGGEERFDTALWESMRLTEEIAALLDEVDSVA